MKKEKSTESEIMTDLEKGQTSFDWFKNLSYSTDRIGQSFVMPVSTKRIEASDQKRQISFEEEKPRNATMKSAVNYQMRGFDLRKYQLLKIYSSVDNYEVTSSREFDFKELVIIEA